jgi:DNA-binding XRE family transcriptional regulator
MAKTNKPSPLPEWTSRIIGLRRRLKMSQSKLAQRVQCSAMTVSRWERGQQAPTAHFYIQLGNLAGKDDCWFFWALAGLPKAELAASFPEGHASSPKLPPMQNARAGSGARVSEVSVGRMVALPILKAVAGTHGSRGDRMLTLDRITASRLMGVPRDWCPNPRYSILLRVRGHSMEPVIRNGDILAVDSLQTDRAELDGKIVVATHEEIGLSVSRLRRYDGLEVLESENRAYEPVLLGKNSGWRIVGKVLWWISAAP